MGKNGPRGGAEYINIQKPIVKPVHCGSNKRNVPPAFKGNDFAAVAPLVPLEHSQDFDIR